MNDIYFLQYPSDGSCLIITISCSLVDIDHHINISEVSKCVDFGSFVIESLIDFISLLVSGHFSGVFIHTLAKRSGFPLSAVKVIVILVFSSPKI